MEEGEYQYKFRLGDGDWWTCDHSKPTVDDGQGNSNNLLVVKSKDPVQAAQPNGKVPEDQQPASVPLSATLRAPEAATAPAPLLNYEVHETQKSKLIHESVRAEHFQMDNQVSAVLAYQTRLARRIRLWRHLADSLLGAATEQTPEREEPNPFEVEDEEPDISSVHAPLLRHESTKPSSMEQDHSPLFRRESISMGDNNHETPRELPEQTVPASSPIPVEADVSDKSLKRFPSDRAGILNEIREASQRQEEQEALSGEKEEINEVEIEVSDLAHLSHLPTMKDSILDSFTDILTGGDYYRNRR